MCFADVEMEELHYIVDDRSFPLTHLILRALLYIFHPSTVALKGQVTVKIHKYDCNISRAK